jgi:hypothetical protein
MILNKRIFMSARAAGFHFLLSAAVALMAATLVFQLWFPAPYSSILGGTELFWLVVGVDVVCGPLLTLVLFNPTKSRRELSTDLGLIALVQLLALAYGLWTLWQVRPLFVPYEVDRFKIIALADLRGASLADLAPELQPSFFKKPIFVALREPRDTDEKNSVLFEAVQGGADYGERPNFYLPWNDHAAAKTLLRAKKMENFLKQHPKREADVMALAKDTGQTITQMRYVPVKARKDWIAILTPTGHVAGFVEGDGF